MKNLTLFEKIVTQPTGVEPVYYFSILPYWGQLALEIFQESQPMPTTEKFLRGLLAMI